MPATAPWHYNPARSDMELLRTSVDAASDPELLRVSADVVYDDRPSEPETYWYELPRRLGNDITATGNFWAVVLLPLAATIGEPLRLSKAVDPILLSNLTRLLAIWRGWYPHLSDVPMIADSVACADTQARRTVAFFSGGIDSFFTLLRERNAMSEPRIDDLLAVWGFDVPLSNPGAFQRMREVLQEVAAAAGKEFIAVSTNLRETRWSQARWGPLAHGCALASVALLLERRWTRVLIASSYGDRFLHPWGSHPHTDPLLSTSRTTVVHDGSDQNRVEKTRLIASSPLAARSLRVCWRSRSDHNCGACEKCYRTMTTLWLLGALDRFTTFPACSFEPERIDRIFCHSEGAAFFVREIRDLARTAGRLDAVAALDRSLARSRRLRHAASALRQVRDVVGAHRASWLLDRLEWRLFRGMIR